MAVPGAVRAHGASRPRAGRTGAPHRARSERMGAAAQRPVGSRRAGPAADLQRNAVSACGQPAVPAHLPDRRKRRPTDGDLAIRLGNSEPVRRSHDLFETLLVEDHNEQEGVSLRFFNLSRYESAEASGQRPARFRIA